MSSHDTSLPAHHSRKPPTAQQTQNIIHNINGLRRTFDDKGSPQPPKVHAVVGQVKVTAVNHLLGVYDAMLFRLRPNRQLTANLTYADLGALPTAADTELWVPDEIRTGTVSLAVGQVVGAEIVQIKLNGKYVAIVLGGGGGGGGGGTLVKVASAAGGASIYNGRTVSEPASGLDPSVDAVEGNIGTVFGSNNCYIINAAEIGLVAHQLTTGSPISRIFVGVLQSTPATDGKPVYVINGYDQKGCA
jgi:hypothetical protein